MDEAIERRWQFRSAKSYEEGLALMDKVVSAGERGVYGEPITRGEHTVITASALTVGMGFGYGGGEAEAKPPDTAVTEEFGPEETAAEQEEGEGTAHGEGGGGGSMASGRPVAIITIGPDGVDVRPVIDWVRIGMAGLAALGAMLRMVRALQRRR